MTDTRTAILRAAKELFGERSPSRVSLREIAARAGVNYGLIHHYFGTKDAVLSAVLQQASQDGAARMSGSSTIEDALSALLGEQGFDAYNRMLAWVLLEAGDVASLVAESPAIAHLAAVLGAPSADALHRHDPEIAAAAIVGAVLGWRFFGPFVRRAAGLDDRPVLDVDREVVAAIRTMARSLAVTEPPATPPDRPASTARR